MKKQYDKSKCKLLSKDLNVEEIMLGINLY